jgi:hypothetical protein
MDWLDVATKLAQLPLSLILMVVVVKLYKDKNSSEEKCHAEVKDITERYHELVSEQVKTLNELEERLR